MAPRDSQRSKLYEAERAVDWSGERKFATVAEIQRYVDRLTDQMWWIKRWPRIAKGTVLTWNGGFEDRPAIVVMDGRGRRRAGAAGRMITMPKWSRTEHSTLHEVAHIVTTGDHASHGWQFAAHELELVHHMMGKAKADALKASFKAHNVRFTKPRAKRVLTEAEKEVLRERLAKARAAGAKKGMDD
jgi:putative metallohydrolase (TIGR04338 family)